jgi:hypothetical protein
MKTGQQIEDDIYSLVINSDLAAKTNGEVYKYGMRPRKSCKEDIVVRFVTGLDDVIQTGRAVVNIYIPDIETNETGVLVRDISRCMQIEKIALDWFDTLDTSSDYALYLAQTIQTIEDKEIAQHFVTIRLEYKLV